MAIRFLSYTATSCLGFFIALPAVAVPAARSEPISLQAAVDVAVAWHPSVDEAIQRLNALEEEVEVARAGYKPRISAGIGSGYDSSVANRWRPRANMTASQMLFDFGKVSSSVRFAQAGERLGAAQVLLAVDGLIRDTGYAVVEAQRANALLLVARDQLADLQGLERLVRHRYERGAATKSDALQAQARVKGAQASMQQIEAELERWRSNLAYLLGRDELPHVSYAFPEPVMRACVSVPEWSDIPAIVEARAARDQAIAEYERSKADRMPTVSFEAGTSTELQDPLSNRADYNFGVRVTSSLFNGGATSARARGSGYRLRAAEAAEARVRNDISRLLAEARQQVVNLEVVMETLAARESDMRETGSLYRLQYLEMGTRTLVDLLNAQQELHQSRFDQVNTEHDMRRLRLDCLFHSGQARQAFELKGRRVQGVTL